jgi:5'-deoxynucleotidase YfbR-like HD superfamily hydrolase
MPESLDRGRFGPPYSATGCTSHIDNYRTVAEHQWDLTVLALAVAAVVRKENPPAVRHHERAAWAE